MINNNSDWYPQSRGGERTLYNNIDAKIDGYAAKYPFLTAGYLAKIHTMCKTFVLVSDKIDQNRATAQQFTTWFENIVTGAPAGDPAPAAPVFQAITLPAGATIGLEAQCRQFAKDFKDQPDYEEADGQDLMIVAPEAVEPDMQTVHPELALAARNDNTVTVNWNKRMFTALELQYRKMGEQMWQAADKSTEKSFNFAPPMTDGTPQKFEFRAVYLLKNQRVGQWSQTYSLTVG